MDISFRVLHRTLFIRVYRVFGYATARKLRELLHGAKIRKYSNVIFDLAPVTALDTSGLGLILSLGRQVKKRGGHIRLINPPHYLRPLLELVHIPGLESQSTRPKKALEVVQNHPSC